MTRARRADLLTGAAVGSLAFLPFLRGILAGASLYFRDLAVGFFPQRRLALDGLLNGRVPLWNPYVHEGVPLSLPAVGYLPDLLQLLRPDERGISILLALHVPFAALALYLLARRHLELPPLAAAAGAVVYSLGGFLLSTVNLYVMLQAAAWAPLVVLGVAEVLARGGGRRVAIASSVVAVAVSTTGVEIVAQAIIVGAVLGVRARPIRAAAGRLGAALVLAAALAAPVFALVSAQVGASARGAGLSADVVVAHSVHPFVLLQTLIGNLFGDLANLAGDWWGQNFFTRGFPYILSLYLGAPALALAVVGASGHHRQRRRLLALVVAGLVVSLGRYAGLLSMVEAAPALRLFRYPVKAFFTVHLSVSLLAALGVGELVAAYRRPAFTRLLVTSTSVGGALLLLAALPFVAGGEAVAFGAAFFPPGLGAGVRDSLLSRIALDAATGGVLALIIGAVAAAARAGSVAPARAALLVLAVVAGDLLRTGSGLNPMVTRGFFSPSPDLADRLPGLRDHRVFTCPFEESPSYRSARGAMGTRHEAWTFAVGLETLTPALNVPLRVPTAMSPDLTMLVPTSRVLPATDRGCADLPSLLPRLRAAAVDVVVSLDPLDHPDLRPDGEWRPARIAPLSVHAYRLASPRPRVELLARTLSAEGEADRRPASARVSGAVFGTSRVDLEVETDEAAVAVVRDGWAPGWNATVDGRPAPVLRIDGRHRGVAVPRGRSRVAMIYRPPALQSSLGACGIGIAFAIALARGRDRRTQRGGKKRFPPPVA